jgi:hypothetical protein
VAGVTELTQKIVHELLDYIRALRVRAVAELPETQDHRKACL